MAITDLPMLSALRTKMHWHQERQRVLSENVANSDTPKFRPRDLVEPKFDKAGNPAAGASNVALVRTSAQHIGSGAGSDTFRPVRNGYETRPAGNSVNLEEQMMKVSSNQMDYAAATSLYTRSLGLLKTAIGRR